MSQHLYTSISVFRYWQNAAKLTEQKVRCERRADFVKERTLLQEIKTPCLRNLLRNDHGFASFGYVAEFLSHLK